VVPDELLKLMPPPVPCALELDDALAAPLADEDPPKPSRGIGALLQPTAATSAQTIQDRLESIRRGYSPMARPTRSSTVPRGAL
jgi:hypothetical protein